MEIRQLTTDYERELFGKSLTKARATRGIGFRDKAGSCLGKVHLAYGGLYALFENERAPVEEMIAGFRLNDLATLPQSVPKPDVGHLSPNTVLEGGELWSLSPGAGRLASRAAGALVGLLQARAVILHAIILPVDLTAMYARLNFSNASEPIPWPFAETIDGGKIMVQPMMIEGDALEDWIRKGFDLLFRTDDDRRVVRFEPSRRSEYMAELPGTLSKAQGVAVPPISGTGESKGNGAAGS
jgi:hypothetical protein